MRIESDNLTDLYRSTIGAIFEHGQEAHPRGMPTKEILGAQLVLTDPYCNILVSPARKLNYRFSVAEWLWMLLGLNDTSVAVFNSKLLAYSDDGQSFAGAYGPKLVEQLPYVIRTLREDPFSRQAVLTIWRERPGLSKDIPCTVAMQFFRRSGKLHMITTMRSNDVYLGLPYDVFNFTQIQNFVTGYLGLGLGTYTHNVGSLHLYETHYEQARVVENERSGIDRFMAASPYLGDISGVWPGVRHWYTWFAQAESEIQHVPTSVLLEKLDTFERPWNMYLKVLASKWNKDIIQFIEEPYRTLLS